MLPHVMKQITACLDGLDGEGMEVYVEEFSEPVIIKTATELNDAFEKYGVEGLATYVYVWTWVPQIPHAPYFPVYWRASNNRFNAQWVWDWWMWLFKTGKEKGLSTIGDVADGDARLRKCEYELNVHNKLRMPTKSLDHPLIFMHISIIDGMPMLGFQDWMHCSGFRVRRQPLDLIHNFQFGEASEVSIAHLRPFLGEHLNEKDLDFHEKQHWAGCCKLFSEETIRKLTVSNDADPIRARGEHSLTSCSDSGCCNATLAERQMRKPQTGAELWSTRRSVAVSSYTGAGTSSG
jgi:hypothetical protein